MSTRKIVERKTKETTIRVEASIGLGVSRIDTAVPFLDHMMTALSRYGGLDLTIRARECVSRGAGEILLTSIDCDGARTGYDMELTRAVSKAVTMPVIASGGAGSAAHLCDVITGAGADAVLVAGILHDGVATVAGLKRAMREAHISVRMAA